MRIIVYGAGAIGGTVAAALSLSGQEVIGLGRGTHLAAMQENGLLLRTPDKTERARFSCVGDPGEIQFRSSDIILLAVKTQDTPAILERLAAAGVTDQPIFCAQNGVANERFALRRFARVHGVTVMMPAAITAPGEVSAFSTPRHGIFEIGSYPSGSDDADESLAAALERANIAAFVKPDVMQGKYGKLIQNLTNIVEAALGDGADAQRFTAMLRAEGQSVLRAAGIAWREVGAADPRRKELMRYSPIEGVARSGGSTTQSLARGADSVETDYLNGEIVLLGRLHNVPVPANAFFQKLSVRMVREKLKPGSISVAEVEAGLQSAVPAG